jgi:hypothetical protein
MHRWFAVAIVVSALGLHGGASGQQPATTAKVIRLAITGETNLKTDFIESLKNAARDAKLTIEIVPKSDPGLDYTVILAQETSVGGAAGAVIALDRNQDVAASVVRSGRFSGGGALNACAKELVKKLAAFGR